MFTAYHGKTYSKPRGHGYGNTCGNTRPKSRGNVPRQHPWQASPAANLAASPAESTAGNRVPGGYPAAPEGCDCISAPCRSEQGTKWDGPPCGVEPTKRNRVPDGVLPRVLPQTIAMDLVVGIAADLAMGSYRGHCRCSYSLGQDALTTTRSDEILYSRCNRGQRRRERESGVLELSS